MRSLVNRFKEFRRPRKPRTATLSAGKEKSIRRRPGITNTLKTPIPLPGEDSVSYERHTKALQIEFKKHNRNIAVIDDLMTRSFAFRRTEIIENTYDLPALFTKFPLLQEADQVSYTQTIFECNYIIYNNTT